MIERNISLASGRAYDLIVVGGGIYGATLVLEAARRGLKPLLVERDDYGGATSFNSLRILHGGLRYLQSLDLRRHRESVQSQDWFVRHFADLVEPLPCLMPLYGLGVRRPVVLRAALALNEFLSGGEKRRLVANCTRPRDRVLNLSETASMFPLVDRTGLRGAALWHDLVIPNAPRMIVEILRWACACGASCLNYVEATDLITDGEQVEGVTCFDRFGDATIEVRAPIVVNCAGPWCRRVAGRFDREVPRLFRPCLVFNVLLDREPPAKLAVAVTPKRPKARTYFLYPWQGGTLAGTYHAPSDREVDHPRAEESHLADFLSDLNDAIAGLEFKREDIRRVFPGFMPAAEAGSTELASRPVVLDHGAHGGPRGLYSVSGVKFTTAPSVAGRILKIILPGFTPASSSPGRPQSIRCPDAETIRRLLRDEPESAAALVQRLVREESVLHLDDLLLRRTGWALHPKWGSELARVISDLPGACQNLASAKLTGSKPTLRSSDARSPSTQG